MAFHHRVIVTGSRSWTDSAAVRTALDKLGWEHDWQLTVVHGACPTGADAIAAAWCREVADKGVIEETHPATAEDWSRQGAAAGPTRNTRMVALGADVCLAFIAPCGTPSCHPPRLHGSHGATHCAARAEAAGIPTRRWRA